MKEKEARTTGPWSELNRVSFSGETDITAIVIFIADF
jgi:hypothetical protein